MEEFVTGANTIWGAIAMLIFVTYKIIDYFILKAQKKKEDYVLLEQFKTLSDKLDDHIELNSKCHLSVNSQIKRVELLQMIHQSPSKALRIEALYKEYKSAGGNSYIDDVFEDWRTSFKQAKKNKNKKENHHES